MNYHYTQDMEVIKTIVNESTDIQKKEYKEKGYVFTGLACKMNLKYSSRLIQRAYKVKFAHFMQGNSTDYGFLFLEDQPISNIEYKIYNQRPIIDLTKKRRLIGSETKLCLVKLIDKYKINKIFDITLNEKRNCIELWYRHKKNKSNYTIFEVHKEDINTNLWNDLEQRLYKEFFK